MRASHTDAMKTLIRRDGLTLENRCNFFLNAERSLVGSKMLVQIIPSLSSGLRYAVFLKKIGLRRMIFGIQNKTDLKYTSKMFSLNLKAKIEYLMEVLNEEDGNLSEKEGKLIALEG